MELRWVYGVARCSQKGEMSAKGTEKILHTKWGDLIIRSQKKESQEVEWTKTCSSYFHWSDFSSLPRINQWLGSSSVSGTPPREIPR